MFITTEMSGEIFKAKARKFAHFARNVTHFPTLVLKSLVFIICRTWISCWGKKKTDSKTELLQSESERERERGKPPRKLSQIQSLETTERKVFQRSAETGFRPGCATRMVNPSSHMRKRGSDNISSVVSSHMSIKVAGGCALILQPNNRDRQSVLSKKEINVENRYL